MDADSTILILPKDRRARTFGDVLCETSPIFEVDSTIKSSAERKRRLLHINAFCDFGNPMVIISKKL